MSLAEAFRNQAQSCARLDSPFMQRLLTLLATDWPTDSALARKLDTFSGDIGPSGHSLPLRVAGGLHALVLSGRSPRLAACYPPHAPDDAPLRDAVLEALATHEAFMIDWVDSPPQTNEVRRSAALIAGARVACAQFDLPVMLSELGASGGLNLMWDHFALSVAGTTLGPADPALTLTPDWTGPLPPATVPRIASRAGVDLNPLNPCDANDLLRLTAYLWADQPERLARTRAAAAVFDAEMTRGDAIDWLEQRLNAQPEGQMHLIQHTVAWQYFPAAAQVRGTALIEAAGAKATRTRPLAWLSMETEGDVTGAVGAALILRLWPGDLRLTLGRADFHGRWVNWTGPT
ncbi:DUF2332 domain-containing protein [Pseudosulfitobacter pseudonitzschiae]|uniref:DUF2332 domain-containing protein n=2 Tax=Pseudosulfitobacter pseudonitzschiae TaxID=1402135 RepID=UPI001AF3E87A|nr:DUF2332 domain-containing protein [Pseudosulfitobacter pseudonitzschiae]MBM1813993.1 DUF2332 domain-containing protein [Pseudosulfitobacter pseudonitzschiae]MBM1830986.1 DUF2332 domain-containing protein [Pseudosulfitobacter pseudonitzschiae]MBM1835853.1 DUF2332 domain-containing protein [Pseudosulfitobacter pseudonitzschiae]MBM1840699.1 DUF2332 domain-containing protein [Pseudosulfitobacter pseudonitzschiae]MBM1845313.1 DUF2332 domain-containing protein [Pseudosulfitobacter pseudonitzschia